MLGLDLSQQRAEVQLPEQKVKCHYCHKAPWWGTVAPMLVGKLIAFAGFAAGVLTKAGADTQNSAVTLLLRNLSKRPKSSQCL